jgi:hypothetical protein
MTTIYNQQTNFNSGPQMYDSDLISDDDNYEETPDFWDDEEQLTEEHSIEENLDFDDTKKSIKPRCLSFAIKPVQLASKKSTFSTIGSLNKSYAEKAFERKSEIELNARLFEEEQNLITTKAIILEKQLSETKKLDQKNIESAQLVSQVRNQRFAIAAEKEKVKQQKIAADMQSKYGIKVKRRKTKLFTTNLDVIETQVQQVPTVIQENVLVECRECKKEFEISPEWYISRDWNIPKACKSCIAIRKNSSNNLVQKNELPMAVHKKIVFCKENNIDVNNPDINNVWVKPAVIKSTKSQSNSEKGTKAFPKLGTDPDTKVIVKDEDDFDLEMISVNTKKYKSVITSKKQDVFRKMCSRVCISVTRNIQCRDGNKCPYAHVEADLVVNICKFGRRCTRGDKCTFKHDDESTDKYMRRMGLRKIVKQKPKKNKVTDDGWSVA